MRQTAERVQVSLYFIYRLKQRYQEAGTLAPGLMERDME
jgi:transposase